MDDQTRLTLSIARLERRNRMLAAGLLGLAACWLIGAGAQVRPEIALGNGQVVDHLVVRKLVIIDPHGRERVVIAAPLPEPRLAGIRSKRGDAVSGILLFDAEGNERGGYVTGDGPSEGASLTLDEIGRMAVSLYANERGTSGLRIGNHDGNAIDIGVNPAGTFLTLYERGETAAVLPAADRPGEDQ